MTMNYQLPKDLTCEHCVLHMWYCELAGVGVLIFFGLNRANMHTSQYIGRICDDDDNAAQLPIPLVINFTQPFHDFRRSHPWWVRVMMPFVVVAIGYVCLCACL